MHRVLKGIAAATLMGAGVLMTGCCGPMVCGGCNSGCGEIYIDPWINEPARCDPCDSCGNYNGQTCGSCRPVLSGLATLWGYRYDGGCDGCDSCDAGFEPTCGIDAPCGGCASCDAGFEPTCGIDAPCGGCASCDAGFEPACGIEAPCGGCDNCGGGHSQYVQSNPVFGHSVVESDPIESSRVVVPPPRRVSRGSAAEQHRPRPRR